MEAIISALQIIRNVIVLDNNWSESQIHCRLHPYVEMDLDIIKRIYPEMIITSKRKAGMLSRSSMEILESGSVNIVGPSTVFLESVILRKPTIMLIPSGFDVHNENQCHQAMLDLIGFLKNHGCFYECKLNNLHMVLEDVLSDYIDIQAKMESLDLSYFVSEVKYEEKFIEYML